MHSLLQCCERCDEKNHKWSVGPLCVCSMESVPFVHRWGGEEESEGSGGHSRLIVGTHMLSLSAEKRGVFAMQKSLLLRLLPPHLCGDVGLIYDTNYRRRSPHIPSLLWSSFPICQVPKCEYLPPMRANVPHLSSSLLSFEERPRRPHEIIHEVHKHFILFSIDSFLLTPSPSLSCP